MVTIASYGALGVFPNGFQATIARRLGHCCSWWSLSKSKASKRVLTSSKPCVVRRILRIHTFFVKHDQDQTQGCQVEVKQTPQCTSKHPACLFFLTVCAWPHRPSSAIPPTLSSPGRLDQWHDGRGPDVQGVSYLASHMASFGGSDGGRVLSGTGCELSRCSRVLPDATRARRNVHRPFGRRCSLAVLDGLSKHNAFHNNSHFPSSSL